MSRRVEIAHVAARVIAEQGLQQASLRDVAREMDVTIGTITHHFRDRDDLLRTTFEVTVSAVRERAGQAAQGLRGIELLAALLSEGLATSKRRRVEAAVWLAFSLSATTNAHHAQLCRRLYQEWEAALSAVLTELGLEAAEAEDAARILIAAADGIALRAMAAPELTAADQERLLAAAIRGIVQAR